MTHDNSFLALVLSWLGLIGSWLTMSHLLGAATFIFTVLQIVIAVRKLRREARLERLEVQLKQPEARP
jgi:uncharacterized membrane protein YccF (DUF307 family)